MKNILKKPRQLVCNVSGNIAITTAILAIPLFGVGGLALDYAMVINMKTKMQAATDSAALALAEEAESLSEDNLLAAAKNYYSVNGGYDIRVKNEIINANYTKDYLEVSASATVPTYLMGVMGFSSTSVSVVSRASVGSAGAPVEMSFVLDNTRSMDYGSWDEVAKTLSETLQVIADRTSDGEFYVTLVPYTDRVNIDLGRENWLKKKDVSGTWEGCVEPLEVSEAGFPYAVDLDAKVGDFMPTTAATTQLLLDNGAKGSECAQPIVGPTQDVELVQNALQDMEPKRSTGRFDDALAWGWRAVREDWAGEWDNGPDYPSKNGDREKIVALFTDGETNINRYEMEQSNGEHGHNGGSNSLFAHFKRVCEAMMADGIKIYIFDTAQNDAIEDTFRFCAKENYYQVDSSSAMKEAIRQLGSTGQTDTVRLIK